MAFQTRALTAGAEGRAAARWLSSGEEGYDGLQRTLCAGLVDRAPRPALQVGARLHERRPRAPRRRCDRNPSRGVREARVKGPWMGAVSPLPGTTAAALAWRSRGRLTVTVLAKATFAFVPDGPMVRAAPEGIVLADVHHRDNPALSIRLGSDLVPRLDRTDVTFTGSAHAPPEGPRNAVPVRLAVFEGQRPRLDKRLLCRDKAAFDRMPIVYERAAGGIGVPENPVGVAFGDANIVDPAQSQRPVGLGPIARAWPSRRRLLGATPRKVFEGPILELPDGFEWSYFQAAPIDQQIVALRGDEWLVLEGLHPTVPQLRTRLPGARGYAWIHGPSASGIASGQRLELRADTLCIDGDAERCTVVWRLQVPVRDEAALAAMQLVVTTAASGEDPGDGRIPPGGEKRTQVLEPPPSSSAAGTQVLEAAPPLSSPPSATGTLMVQSAPGPAERPALPFTEPAPGSAAPRAEAPAPRRAAPAAGSTLAITGSPAAASPALPFAHAAAAPQAAPAAPKPPVELSIEQLATVAAELAERREPRADVLGRHGLDEAGFAESHLRWTERIQREASRGQSTLRSAHDAAYLAAVAGFRGPITVNDYARIVLGLEWGTADAALDALSIQRPALGPIVRVWTRKVAADPRLSGEVRALLASLHAPGAGGA
jgi:hypothetical protein